MIDSPVRPAPLETVTPLKASEAIRLGCLTTTQAFGSLGGDGTACVMGAMYIGLGVWDGGNDSGSIHEAMLNSPSVRTIWLGIGDFPCPLNCDDTLHRGAAHLNDVHRWTRERIADYMETRGW